MIVGVFGPVASGKTFLLKQWVQSLNRVVILDSRGEFSEYVSFQTIWTSPRKLLETVQRRNLARTPLW